MTTNGERLDKEGDALRAQLEESAKRADVLEGELKAAKAQVEEASIGCGFVCSCLGL